jgi:hypothetical protein
LPLQKSCYHAIKCWRCPSLDLELHRASTRKRLGIG